MYYHPPVASVDFSSSSSFLRLMAPLSAASFWASYLRSVTGPASTYTSSREHSTGLEYSELQGMDTVILPNHTHGQTQWWCTYIGNVICMAKHGIVLNHLPINITLQAQPKISVMWKFLQRASTIQMKIIMKTSKLVHIQNYFSGNIIKDGKSGGGRGY